MEFTLPDYICHVLNNMDVRKLFEISSRKVRSTTVILRMHRLSIRPRTFLTSQSFKRTLENHASNSRDFDTMFLSFRVERLISIFSRNVISWFHYAILMEYFGKFCTIFLLDENNSFANEYSIKLKLNNNIFNVSVY